MEAVATSNRLILEEKGGGGREEKKRGRNLFKEIIVENFPAWGRK